MDRYDPLVAALEQAYEKVIPFPYDGRGTLDDTARLLLEQGIVGMRERARLLGGTLEARPRPDGGFRVVAHLPTGGEPA